MSDDSEIAGFEKEIQELEKIKKKIVLKKTASEKKGVVFSKKISSLLSKLRSLKKQESEKPSESHLKKVLDINKKVSEVLALKQLHKAKEVEPSVLSEQEEMLQDITDQLYFEPVKNKVSQKKAGFIPELIGFAGKIGLIEKEYALPEEKTSKAGGLLEVRIFNEFGHPLDASKAVFFFDAKKLLPVSFEANTAFFDVSGEEIIVKMLGYAPFKGLMPYKGQPLIVRMDSILKIVVIDEMGKKVDSAFITLTDETGNRVEDINANYVWKTPFPEDAETGTAYIALNQSLLSPSLLVWCVKAGYNETRIIVPAELFSSQTQAEQTIRLNKIVQKREVKANVPAR